MDVRARQGTLLIAVWEVSAAKLPGSQGYPTVDEYHKRLRIFSDNVDYIERTNAAGGPTRVKLNKYADLTLGEFKAANFRMPDHRRHKQA